MANIPGTPAGLLPGVFTDTITQSRGAAVPGGSRIASMIGEGSTDETIVSTALGGGKDGLDPTYTSPTGADGRHFQLQNFPLISNRSSIFRNGILLHGIEQPIDTNPFSNKYDYRLDIELGQLELQQAHLVDQGGTFYTALTTNVGDGYISNLTLVDVNSQPQNWTIRCISVQRDNSNNPIQGTASFLAIGSISGSLLDANGNPIIWVANDNIVSNGVLSFSIAETETMSVATSVFREGDGFLIEVASGVLVRGDSLTANYIPSANINDPLQLFGMGDVVKRHGLPSTDNNLSLGAQLAFANNASNLITVQAAPPMPRRTSYILSPSVNSLSTDLDDFIFPLPAGVTPDFNSTIHFFVKNNATNVEKQILPNKLEFYSLDTVGFPTTSQFINDNTPAPGGFSYYYTVKQGFEDLADGTDGYIGRNLAFSNQGVFSSSVSFDSTYVGKELKIIDADNVANIGTYTINNVLGDDLYVTYNGAFPDFTDETSEAFEVIEPTTGLPIAGGSGTDGTLVAIISTATATLHSTAINFNLISGILTKKLQINGSSTNDGLYDITAYDSGTNTLTIKKVLVNESGMRYEVLDTTEASNYIVINHNVVPNGNGLRVTIVDSRDATFYDAGWINALAALEVVECDIVVPLPKQTISVIFQNALSHVINMSNIVNRKERVLFIGAINGLTPDNLTGVKLAAVEDIGVLEGIQGATVTDVLNGNIEDLANYSVSDAFGETYRVVYFYPDQIVVQAGTSNVLIDGFYLAAAAAGYEVADVRLENPLTNKVLTGFTILRNKQFSVTVLQQLAASGVTTLQPVAGGGVVVWGITTSQSGFVEEQEISIIFIRDRVAKTLRAGFQGLIGTPGTNDTGAIINTRAVVILNSLVSQGLITKYASLSVQQDDVDPRQWDVTVQVQPSYPVNWIYIKISVGQI